MQKYHHYAAQKYFLCNEKRSGNVLWHCLIYVQTISLRYPVATMIFRHPVHVRECRHVFRFSPHRRMMPFTEPEVYSIQQKRASVGFQPLSPLARNSCTSDAKIAISSEPSPPLFIFEGRNVRRTENISRCPHSIRMRGK